MTTAARSDARSTEHSVLPDGYAPPNGVGSLTMAADLVMQLVRAVSTQNEDALAECFSPDVEFRALVPPGLRERTGARAAASLFTQWLGDSTDLQLVD